MERSLDIARQRAAFHEVAFGLEALLELFTEPDGRWQQERSRLAAQLGPEPTDRLPRQARDVVVLPDLTTVGKG